MRSVTRSQTNARDYRYESGSEHRGKLSGSTEGREHKRGKNTTLHSHDIYELIYHP